MRPMPSFDSFNSCCWMISQNLYTTLCIGPIPSDLGALSSLEELRLSFNRLDGEANVCHVITGEFNS